MSDNEEPLFMSDLESDDGNTEKIKIENQETDLGFGFLPDDHIDLCSDDDGPEIKKEIAEMPKWTPFGERIVEISDSEEDVVVKKEPQDPHFKWENIQGKTIMLADSDDEEDMLVLDDGSMVPIKKEPEEGRHFEWLDMDETHFDLDPSLRSCLIGPKRKAVRRQLDPDKLQELTKKFAQQAREKYAASRAEKRATAGAGAIFTQPSRSAFPPAKLPTIEEDGIEWMNSEIVPDDIDPAESFHELKTIYKAKKRVRKNTLQDDIEFKRAQAKESERVNRLMHDTAHTDDSDEAEESDDGLFLSQATAYAGLTKRGLEDGDDDEASIALIEALTGESFGKQKKREEIHSQEASDKRKRDNLYKKEFARELRFNMMAGIEAILLRDQMKQEMKAAKALAAEEASKSKGRSKKMPKPASLRPKRTKAGRVSNVGSLITSNVYADSNANLTRAALPIISEKRKKDYLTTIIAKVPLEDKNQARSDKNDVERATKILGSHKVKADGKGGWSFKGMRSSLYHHQVQGSACMKIRELGNQDPKGGILADQMGMGKTIQTLAAMVANRQTDPEYPKSTLIVCSPALMKQWEDELEKHVDPKIFRRVVRHHASGTRYSGKGAAHEMEHADIILTTYGEVVRSYPKSHIPRDVKDPTEKEAYWLKEWNFRRGLLHRAHFYRVILDEAHAIKTHTSQTSIACRAIMARHRWAITGTPIQNRLDELFPYFKFLRVPHTGSMPVFRHNYCLEDNEECLKRLIGVISGLMIRRTHADSLFGAPIIKLPENHQTTINLKFNRVERYLYEIIRLRCIRAINVASEKGLLEENTEYVIVMFQRLRQMVAHIFSVQEVLEKELELEQVEHMLEDLIGNDDTQIQSHEQIMVAHLQRMINEKDTATDSEEGKLFEGLEEGKDPPIKNKKKSKDLVARFAKILREHKKASRWAELKENTLCQQCGEPPEDPYVTSCYHLYCRECLTTLALEAADKDLDQAECATCGHAFSESQPCTDLKELEIRDLSATVFQEDVKDKAQSKPKFKLTMKYVDSNNQLVLSTKLIAVKEQLAQWIEADPNAKIIVFTEWLMVMHLVGRICQQEGWKSCQYNGKISHGQREQALQAFQDGNANIRVMVASLKCGGIGLNLTAASKVICVDLWFNRCVEQQAFCRVHRIGQTKETYITRFKVENTVDDRLLEMQDRKQVIIDNAIDNKAVLSKLTMEELMSLFGTVERRGDKSFIMVEDLATIAGAKKQRKRGNGDAEN